MYVVLVFFLIMKMLCDLCILYINILVGMKINAVSDESIFCKADCE